MTGDTAPSWDASSTPWGAAYAYAEVIRDLTATRRTSDKEVVPTLLIAYSIASYARDQRVSVTSPRDLQGLSLVELHSRMEPIALIVSLSGLSLSDPLVPGPSDPGYEAFSLLKATIDDGNAGGVEAMLDDAKQLQRAKAQGEKLLRHAETAQKMITGTVMRCADGLHGDVLLKAVADGLGSQAADIYSGMTETERQRAKKLASRRAKQGEDPNSR